MGLCEQYSKSWLCSWHDTARLERLLKSAKLKNPQACIEDIECRQSRGIDKSIVAALVGCDWIRNAQNLTLAGPTGTGTRSGNRPADRASPYCTCVFRTNVTSRFGIATERTGRQDWRCA